ncbi:MAG: acyl-CoA synthetase [Actinomycetota bacterium]|nr:acyl-CoA synthetase [Actinomycetota bacterium]
MPLGVTAAERPDAIATIMARSGEQLTYRELDERSRRLANLFRAAGLGHGDVVAVFMENNIRFHEVYWATVRSGMYLCAVNRYLTPDEAAYIVNDSGASALVTSAAMTTAPALLPLLDACPVRLAVDGPVEGFDAYEPLLAEQSTDTPETEPLGDFMNYSSGTTGRPKGIKRPLTGRTFDEPSNLDTLTNQLYGVEAGIVYLSPAPLYHSAPLAFTATVHSWGGTNVIMERFDAAESLALIERHRVTHSQWVPTMFIRMLKLEEAERTRHDLSSHRVAIHAAAPCPVDVKKQMIDWWGPIIYEYYGGTELNGLTYCTSEEWLAHEGSVGRAILGTLHICDSKGRELPPGEDGLIYFERDVKAFEYHNDPDKTAGSQHPTNPMWTKLGDIGRLDEDGFLYLSDRESFMIISGGVNIYPQEIEDAMVMHPDVADVAVIGIPNDDLGEEVLAVVQLAPGVDPDDATRERLLAHARERLARYKVPRGIDFSDQLPRLETGKLYKRKLRDEYLAAAAAESSGS